MPPLTTLTVVCLATSFVEISLALLVKPDQKLVWEIRSISSMLFAAIFWCTSLILKALRRQ